MSNSNVKLINFEAALVNKEMSGFQWLKTRKIKKPHQYFGK